MNLADKIRAVAAMPMSDDLLEEMVIALVSTVTGRKGGRRRTDPPPTQTCVGRKALHKTEGLADKKQSPPLPPGSDPDLDLSGSDPDPSKPSSPEVVRKSAEEVGTQEFRDWYAAYPLKRNRLDAWKAWRTVSATRPPLEQMRAALDWQRKTADWTKDGGAYVPYPGTYLRAGGWADERRNPTSPGAPFRQPSTVPTAEQTARSLQLLCTFHSAQGNQGRASSEYVHYCKICQRFGERRPAPRVGGEAESIGEIMGGVR